jgi:cysteinyl-tRNA synthetase
LRHLYGREHVTYARNITDVDDKIIVRAAEEGVGIDELTARTTRQFHEDVKALGCLEPTLEPKATEHIPEMIAMIGRLIDTGNAYEAEGHVLFHVPSMKDYGKLARRSLEDMQAGARVEVAPYKRDPMDFVLWKPAKDKEPGWDSPWGLGRPGWHIECSAMSAAHLGETFDIHGGGIDLVFPHHENELAQSRCAHGTEIMARYWMHNGFLQVEGEKMAKSLGNFVTIRELLKGEGRRPWPGEAIRFNMLRAHYRQPLDWTSHGLDESHAILWDWYGDLEGVTPAEEVPESVVSALRDDMNMAEVIAALHRLAKDSAKSSLAAALKFLGFSGDRAEIRRNMVVQPAVAEIEVDVLPPTIEAGIATVELPTTESIMESIAARNEARKRKDFTEADRIRDELAAMGIALKDGPQGTTWEVAR